MVPEMFSLKGKAALVTGASRGLGWAIAEALASAGARVVLNSRDHMTVWKCAAALGDAGYEASAVAFDVGDEAAVNEGMKKIATDIGGIDILVNNAGANHRAPLEDFPVEIWRRILDVNLTGAFLLSRLAVPHMKAQKRGRIINVASILAMAGRATVPAYSASKHGMAGLTRALAAELGPDGITVNAICPGYIKTDMTRDLQKDPEFDRKVTSRTPLGRWGRASEIGGVAAFLASDAASYVNGHLLVADGGMTQTV